MRNNKTRKKFKITDLHRTREIEQEKILLLELEDFLKKREKKTDKLVVKLSHEFRTPLVPILAYSQMLLEGHFGDLSDSQKERLSVIKYSADSLLQLISNKKFA
jgi:signal transduction histidine kinase